jgi:hypothetical protein
MTCVPLLDNTLNNKMSILISHLLRHDFSPLYELRAYCQYPKVVLADAANNRQNCGGRSAVSNGDSWRAERPFDLGCARPRGTLGFTTYFEAFPCMIVQPFMLR